MTPFAALHTLAGTFADLRQQDALKAPPWHLTLCLDCERALLRELDGLFAPVREPHRMTLTGSQVMGFTFGPGPPATCALHALLPEVAP